jgi:hypothetical protein
MQPRIATALATWSTLNRQRAHTAAIFEVIHTQPCPECPPEPQLPEWMRPVQTDEERHPWGTTVVDDDPLVAPIVGQLRTGCEALMAAKRQLVHLQTHEPCPVLQAVLPESLPHAVLLAAHHCVEILGGFVLQDPGLHVSRSAKRARLAGSRTTSATAGLQTDDSDANSERTVLGRSDLDKLMKELGEFFKSHPATNVSDALVELPGRVRDIMANLRGMQPSPVGTVGAAIRGFMLSFLESLTRVARELKIWWDYRVKMINVFAVKVQGVSHTRINQVNTSAQNVWSVICNSVSNYKKTATELLGDTSSQQSWWMTQWNDVMVDGHLFQSIKPMGEGNFEKMIEELDMQVPDSLKQAADGVLASLYNQHPQLRTPLLTTDLLMDASRNSLYTEFAQLVGLDITLTRRMSGVKTTFVSDYARINCTAKCLASMFADARVSRDQHGVAVLNKQGLGLRSGSQVGSGLQLWYVMGGENQATQLNATALGRSRG